MYGNKLPKLEATGFNARVTADTGIINSLFINVLKEASNSFILFK